MRAHGQENRGRFLQDGEANFRHIERRVCRLCSAQGLVIATGGGMLVDAGNRQVMLVSGLVVCLRASKKLSGAPGRCRPIARYFRGIGKRCRTSGRRL